MADVTVELPEDLLQHLAGSRLGHLDEPSRVRAALAIFLFLTQEISIGRAAELAGQPYLDFWHLLTELDLPTVFYGREEYARDLEAIKAVERERRDGGDG
jgi:predicted HTH domain antitoxin